MLKSGLENPDKYTIMRVTFPTIPPEQRFAWGIPLVLRFGFIFLLISLERGDTMKKNDSVTYKYGGFIALFLGLSIILVLELLVRWFGK